MSLVYEAVKQNAKMLQNLDGWLTTAEEHAKAKSFPIDTLLQARLAPDQYPLVRQIQAACDNAKFAAARLAGKEPPKHADTETTLPELRARIADVVKYVDSFGEKDFEGAEDRKILLSFLEGKALTGTGYLEAFVTPNFYFHVVTAYAILRHNGVDLGKMKFIGALPLQDR